jgi:DNA-binding MarR family transcriptional regulator
VSQVDVPAPAVSSLAKTAGIAITTAFRWIDYLEEKRLIERQRSSDDGRALSVILSRDGRARLEAYFADVLDGIIAARQEIDIVD